MRNLRLGSVALAIFVTPLVVLGCQTAPPKAGSPGAAARGRDLFKTCSPCHGAHGGGDMNLRAPAIAGLPDWYLKNELMKFQSNIRGAHPDDQEGHRMRPMARTLYHPGDLDAVIAYVTKLPVVVSKPVLTGDAQAGQTQYTAICVACHGPDGKGMQALSAPPLVQQADWYLLSQLKKFKTGMRGAHPQDVTGSQMRAMSSTLQDTTAMRNVVAYIMSLSR